MGRARQGGSGLLLAALVLIVVLASLGARALNALAASIERDRASERSLAQAREALVSHAADRPIDARVGPGYLPCPDLDDDGWAEPTCGSLDGRLGQRERLGRLPWKTLGLPDLRDGHGERLWYAVSSRHKGLLNCAASRACVDMTPATALGTITVRDATGAVIHDGRLADALRAADAGAAAVVIAPGPPLARSGDGREQRRDCAPGDCDAHGRCLAEPPWRAARCDPRNYLDAAIVEDNADFNDRNDAPGRPANGDGFIAGPVALGPGRVAVNDRLAVVAYNDVMPRVMARVALEIAHCVRQHVLSSGHMPPPPDAACGWGASVGRVDDDFLRAASAACNASLEEPAWWPGWKPHVLYALGAPSGLEVADEQGRVLATGRRFAILVSQRAGDCAAGQLACGESGCTRVAARARSRERHDVLVAMP